MSNETQLLDALPSARCQLRDDRITGNNIVFEAVA
jgi:hypothetical protein